MKLKNSIVEKTNPLFEGYKLLFDGKEEDLGKISSSLVKPLIHWLSFNKENLDICQRLNKYFMYVKSDILLWILYYKIDIGNKFIKRNKVIYDTKLDFLKNYIKKYFSWSEREFLYNKKIIDKLLVSEDVKKQLNETFGFSKDECKKLNLDYVSYKKKRKDYGSQSLFSFVKPISDLRLPKSDSVFRTRLSVFGG